MMEISKKTVIGITGTQGAGKDTAAEFLVQKFGFKHFSLSDIVREETAKRSLPATRDNWRETADSLRAEFGNDVMAIKMVEKIKNIDAKGFVITSFRHPGEVWVIKESYPNFKLVSIDLPIELRYKRIKQRGKLADNVTLEEFKAQEKAENVSTTVGMRIREVMALADLEIMNTGAIEDMENKLGDI